VRPVEGGIKESDDDDDGLTESMGSVFSLSASVNRGVRSMVAFSKLTTLMGGGRPRRRSVPL